MNCPGCNYNIPDESKFCKECGFNLIEHDSKQVNKKAQRSPASITVLIVDDNNFMRIVLKKLLSKHGFNVAGEASDAEDAVKIYKEIKPDLVMMDISMPGTREYHHGGLDAISDIISIDRDAKIIVCSAMSDKSIVMKAIERGAKAYVVKPFDTHNLVDTINRLFE
ncbi:MAG: response regulator [Candidatus Eremiobacterota bacterium]